MRRLRLLRDERGDLAKWVTVQNRSRVTRGAEARALVDRGLNRGDKVIYGSNARLADTRAHFCPRIGSREARRGLSWKINWPEPRRREFVSREALSRAINERARNAIMQTRAREIYSSGNLMRCVMSRFVLESMYIDIDILSQ